jgi:hypothetical protein
MKYIISVTIALVCIVRGTAQIENIRMASDSSVVIDKVYVGMLSGTAFNTKTLKTTSFVTARFGAMASWHMTKHVSVRSFGMLETDLTRPWGIQQFYVHVAPTKHWSLTFGQMATPSTEQRPHPVSSGGQFETSTQAKIPGGAPGIKIKYTGAITVGAGLAVRNGSAEYHAMCAKGAHTFSGYYRTSDKQKGFAYTYDGTKLYSVIVYIPRALLGTTTVLRFKNDVAVFADVGYGLDQSKLTRMEGGCIKRFKSKWVKGLFSLTYDYKTTCVNGYVFIHL